jgi:hypothetical protein
MRNAIIVHGMPSKEEYYDPELPSSSNYFWIPWLQKQLLMREIAAHTPEIPSAYKPHYPSWRKEFERFDILPDTILVGHSCGGGFLVRWLSEHPEVTMGAVVLVAPWLDLEREFTTDFFAFEIDSTLAARMSKLVVFNSNDDVQAIQASVRLLRDKIAGLTYREFQDHGHFVEESMEGPAFPELLEEVLT